MTKLMAKPVTKPMTKPVTKPVTKQVTKPVTKSEICGFGIGYSIGRNCRPIRVSVWYRTETKIVVSPIGIQISVQISLPGETRLEVRMAFTSLHVFSTLMAINLILIQIDDGKET